MPNIIDANGLQTATRAELIANLTAALQAIYGSNITVTSNSPDGQWINIQTQAAIDSTDLIRQVYNGFDPDNAVGIVLDQRVAINGIQRQGGTYTTTNVTIVNNQSVNLYGLDGVTTTPDVRDDGQPIYTVADNAGHNWLLETTQLGLSAGTHALSFRAAVPGAQFTVPNTITVPVTIVIGVTSINNPTTYTTLGINEETDAELRIRRQKSVSLASQGYLPGLLAALENVTGVTAAFVYENDTSTTDGDGVPGHSIWVIVAGNPASEDIAQAIYAKRNAGCGMFGSISYTIVQVDGKPFTLKWDSTVTQNMFIEFTASSINGVTAPNIEAIRNGLVSSFVPGVNAEVNINELGTLVQQIDPNTLVTNAGFSLATSQILSLSASPASGTFKVLYNGNISGLINWNDSASAIQTKIRLVPGLSTATVSGSISSHVLIISVGSTVLGLISVTDNTLLTSGSIAVTFTYSTGFSTTLSPSTKRNQLVVSSENIIILPMILNPVTSSIPAGNTQTYIGLGGYGDYIYSIQTNNSGGTIDSSSGLYTAGATNSVTDTIKVVDALGNSITATVSVV